MKKNTIILVLGSIAVVVVLAILFLVPFSEGNRPVEEEGSASDEELDTKPRHTAPELEEGVSKLRKQRGKLPIELAAEMENSPDAATRWTQALDLQKQTPEQALNVAREKLVELDGKLNQDSLSEKEHVKLMQQRRMVSEILSKLEKMVKGN